MESEFFCARCRQTFPTPKLGVGCGTGYATTPEGDRVCYDCCATVDREFMREKRKNTLYLTKKGGKWGVSNWCGTLFLPCGTPRKGRHNIARTRYDVWFSFEGQSWHGVQYGDMTQICHCRRVKK